VKDVHALPILVTALCVLALAFRYYSAFLAAKVAMVDETRETPAHALADGQNYHATNKWVLFGHHFAAISGAGPLVGPVLAAQFGYLPGLLWLVIGVVLAGATQDFLVLVASIRHRGRSLAEIAKEEVSLLCGRTAIVAILFIVVIALAGLGIVVKKALGGEEVALPKGTLARAVSLPSAPPAGGIYELPKGVELVYPGNVSSRLSEGGRVRAGGAEATKEGCAFPLGCSLVVKGSAWGTFTIACTIPIAFFIGLYMYRLRKGKVVEASAIGALLVLAATWAGGWVAATPALAACFDLTGDQVTWAMMGYGFIASVLPVWLLLCPRDYLSSYLKIGTVAILVVGTLLANPRLQLPPLTHFPEGKGPLFEGKIFPFVFITIMCGAISGFHSLVSSGTTPKMIQSEGHARMIGYGAMLMEGLVGIVALIAVAALPPQDYFAINTPLTKMTAPETQKSLKEAGFADEEDHLPALEAQVNEQLRGRSGGAVSLAVGMASVLAPEGSPFHGYVDYWYHFAIMFEALFILTTIDTGTRIARFLLQEALGAVSPALGNPSSVVGAVLSTGTVVACWGALIMTGQIETIWPMFGISNQLLAVIALSVVTTWIVNQGRGWYALTTLLPLAFVTSTTMTAGVQLMGRFHRNAASAPEKAWLWNLNLVLVAVMLGCVVLVLADCARACLKKVKALKT
jgi:carbon starvation protein